MGLFSFGFNVREWCECSSMSIQDICRTVHYQPQAAVSSDKSMCQPDAMPASTAQQKILSPIQELRCKKTVGDYLAAGKLEMGLMRVEQAIQVQNTLKALEIIEVFLEMVRTRTEYLAKQKQIPDEMRTSLLSIAYAANRMPDIPELGMIRKQFEHRFGREAFAEVSMEDPSSAGVQEKLLKFLTVDPPRAADKVEVAMNVVEERRLECTPEELNEVLGISIDPVPRANSSQPGQYIPFIPGTAAPPPAAIPHIPEPLAVNEFGNPAPALDSSPAPPAQFPMRTAQTPTQVDSTFAAAPAVPVTSAHAPPPAADMGRAASAATAAPGYLEAINAAMRGATTGDHPVLDAANPGPEGYVGTKVEDSIPALPPAAAEVQPSDLLFPDVKWMDAPPPPPPPADGGVASISDLPAAPSHDPNMPSAPRFSHTGAVYDPEKSEEGSVHDDLVERLKRLQQ